MVLYAHCAIFISGQIRIPIHYLVVGIDFYERMVEFTVLLDMIESTFCALSIVMNKKREVKRQWRKTEYVRSKPEKACV